MATVKQIAKLANVSIGTVSNVLNGLPSVRDAARQRVMKAIKDLEYQPSLLGRALRKDKTNMIVMIVPDITNPFFPGAVRGAEDIAFQNDCCLVLCNSDNDVAKEAAYMREMRTYRPSGLILVPSDLSKGSDEAQAYLQAGAGVVYMDRIPPKWRGDAVTSAHENGAYMATKHLIELGHKRIATIAGPLTSTSAVERLRGFRRAMKQAGLQLKPEYVIEANFDTSSGHEKTSILLSLSTPPTAIFAANDLIAFGALRAIRDAGLCCPEDMSVIGFDNLDLGDTAVPSLSTVDQFAYDLGVQAVQIIVKRIAGDKSTPRHVRIPTALRLKNSTCPPRTSTKAALRQPVANRKRIQ